MSDSLEVRGTVAEPAALVKVDLYPTDEAPFRLLANSQDVSLWERTHRGRTLQSLQENMSMQALEEITHVALRRQGLFTGNLNEFRERYAIVPVNENDDEDDEAEGGLDPTQPDR